MMRVRPEQKQALAKKGGKAVMPCPKYKGRFVILDKRTGEPAAGLRYKVIRDRGPVTEGMTDDEGLTLPTPVEIKFEGKGDKCTVMVSIERLQTRAEADGYRRAWGEALDRLKAKLEAG